MATLAIKGHPTRGSEVIALLEMLGGKNTKYCCGGFSHRIYFIDKDNNIIDSDRIHHLDYVQLTLEEFEEKFPYKVGDKVITKDKFIGTIIDIKWQGNSLFVGKEEGDIIYTVQVSTTAQITYQKEDLQPYKEKTMEEKPFECIDFVKYPPNTDKFEIILGNYEIVQEIVNHIIMIMLQKKVM